MERYGPYALLGTLGRGGMGTVYRALDGRNQRQVALKVLNAGARASEVQRQRFLRPALAAALVQALEGHAGAVVVYNLPFESARLTELAAACPEHSKRLLDLRARGEHLEH
ncbi:MAG: DUF2779 domain-containing protein [Planctomycetota bacterium]